MIVKENESLKKYTTVRIGGIASKFYIPESVEELAVLLKEHGQMPIISGGSNLLINDERTFDKVLFLGKVDTDITIKDGIVYAGASVRLQVLINTINENGFGGIEYLYSVPGMLGGAIYMNAGRGSDKKCISDFLIDVRVMDYNGNVSVMTKEECKFKYRESIFMESDLIIVGASFKFPEQTLEESKRLIAERLETCKKYQDNAKPNFGSVFCAFNVKIMNFIKKHRKLFCNSKAHFSDKTTNWIINEGDGTFRDAMKCINKAKRIHKLFRKHIEVEVRIWE